MGIFFSLTHAPDKDRLNGAFFYVPFQSNFFTFIFHPIAQSVFLTWQNVSAYHTEPYLLPYRYHGGD